MRIGDVLVTAKVVIGWGEGRDRSLEDMQGRCRCCMQEDVKADASRRVSSGEIIE